MFKLTFAEYARPRLATFVKYGKVELTPPSPAELPAAVAQATGLVKSAMTFKWTQLTVKVCINMKSQFSYSAYQGLYIIKGPRFSWSADYITILLHLYRRHG